VAVYNFTFISTLKDRHYSAKAAFVTEHVLTIVHISYVCFLDVWIWNIIIFSH